MTALDNYTDTCHRCEQEPVSSHGVLCIHCRREVTPTIGAVPILIAAFLGLVYALAADIAGWRVVCVSLALPSLLLLVLGACMLDRQ